MASKINTIIRYDGPALAEHEMDVQDLAPALLALAELVQIANRKFNGSSASIRVLVNADVHQKCFMLSVSLVQTLMEQAKGLLGSDYVKTAKEIAETLGILGVPAGLAGLIGLVKWLADRKQKQEEFSIKQEGGNFQFAVTGSHNHITVNQQVVQLIQDPDAARQVAAIVKPLTRKGYDTLQFMPEYGEPVTIDQAEAATIVSVGTDNLIDVPTENEVKIEGKVRIKAAQYEGSAKWSFLLQGKQIEAEMVGEAEDWVADFQGNKVSAPPNSVLDVSMIETVKLDRNGNALGKPRYAITHVRSVTPPPDQLYLPGVS